MFLFEFEENEFEQKKVRKTEKIKQFNINIKKKLYICLSLMLMVCFISFGINTYAEEDYYDESYNGYYGDEDENDSENKYYVPLVLSR